MSATKQEAEDYLRELKDKLIVGDIFFRNDRSKNQNAITELEIQPIYREKCIKELCAEDYSEGPLDDLLNGKNAMWVFGIDVKGTEVYVKVQVAIGGVICISFHPSEHPMNYPLKK